MSYDARTTRCEGLTKVLSSVGRFLEIEMQRSIENRKLSIEAIEVAGQRIKRVLPELP